MMTWDPRMIRSGDRVLIEYRAFGRMEQVLGYFEWIRESDYGPFVRIILSHYKDILTRVDRYCVPMEFRLQDINIRKV